MAQRPPDSWLEQFRPPVVARLADLLSAVRTLGLPWAPGVVVRGRDVAAVVRQAGSALAELEALTGRRWGDSTAPLVITVQHPAPGSALDPSRCVPGIASSPRLEEVLADAATRWTPPGGAPEVLLRLDVAAVAPVIGAGVVCTRDPMTGAPGLHGEWRPPGTDQALSIAAMRTRCAAGHAMLERALSLLEASYRQVCALEFALTGNAVHITSGSLGVPAVPGAIRMVVDLVDEGLLSPREALEQLPLSAMEDAQRPVVSAAGTIVAAQPDSYAARILAWCSDHHSAAVVASPPAGFVPVRQPDSSSLRPGAPGYLVDPPATSAPVVWALLVAELLRLDAPALAVVYNPALDQIMPSLAAAPWTHVVASPAQTWAAQVLAARLGRSRYQPSSRRSAA